MLIAGMSNKEIAAKLQLTEGTVKTYAAGIYKKMRLGSGNVNRLSLRVRAVTQALQDRPTGDCAKCVFQGFARWAQTVAGQLLEVAS